MKKTILLVVPILLLSVQFLSGQTSCVGDAPGAGWTTGQIKAGSYHDLGVNANGLLWAVGINGVELIVQGNLPCVASFPTSLAFPGGESVDQGAIASAPDNSVWVVTNLNEIWQLPPPSVIPGSCSWVNGWVKYPGAAHDIAVTSDGTVWVTGTNSVGGGWGIWYYNPTSGNWVSVQGGAVRIAAATGGVYDNAQPWVVNSFNQIIHRNSDGSWQGYTGAAWDIALDASGLPVVVGTFHAQGSRAFVMYFWNTTLGWVTDPNIPNPFGGAAITSGIQVAANQTPWCHVAYFIDDAGNIWRLTA